MNEFLNIDCMIGMAEYEDNHFDLAIVDPPYGIGKFWLKQTHTKHYGVKEWNEKHPTKGYFKELLRVSKNQIIFGANYYCHYLPITNSWIVWRKGNDVEKTNTSECELAWTSFNIPLREIFIQWSGGRKGNETGIKSIHPCQRPISLYKWLLTKYAKQGDLILDTHVGSASSLIACEDMGFEYVGFELDEDYYKAAQKRLSEHRKQIKLFPTPNHQPPISSERERLAI